VGQNDIFPEEFAPFLLSGKVVRQAFLEHHSDLLDVGFWNETKQRIEEGFIEDVYPYPAAARFAARFPAGGGA
jgi:isocitrate dehydrogenase kinase/phosphatase